MNIELIDEPNLDNIKKTRKVKTLPHKYLKDYDYSIWVDAGFEIIGDLKKFINEFSSGKSFMSCVHTERDCIYDEAIACIDFKKDTPETINLQINKYKKGGFPKKWGLIESGVIFRKHNDPKLIKVMEEWFNEILQFSTRDQISLPYVLWKNSYEIDKYRIFYWKNQYFEHYSHQDINSIKFNLTNNLILLRYKFSKKIR